MFKRWNLLYRWMGIFMVIFASGQSTASESTQKTNPVKSSGKILVVMTNHATYPSRSDTTGLWLTELTHFYDVAQAAGYDMDFVSPQGGTVPLDERSLKSIYMDASAKAHLADPNFVQRLNTTLAPNAIDSAHYQAVYYTGGHGTMWDFPTIKPYKRSVKKFINKVGLFQQYVMGSVDYCL